VLLTEVPGPAARWRDKLPRYGEIACGEGVSDDVRVTVEGGVRTVLLDRPAKRNALTVPMLNALEAVFSKEPGPDERVAVIRASGPAFCAGIDLTERVPRPSRGERKRPSGGERKRPSGGERTIDGAEAIERALYVLEGYPLPVVAVVAGDAIAGGAELAFHCDLVLAADTARIGMSVAQIGLVAPWPLVCKLVDVAGPVVARELLLVGDPVPASRLAELGVIMRAVPADDLEAEAQRLIDRLRANAPLSLRAMKAALVRASETREALTHDDIDALARAARHSDDAREGMRARLEKRPATFTGR
jgi:enoyl-CoA hydratase/carnithine racemase